MIASTPYGLTFVRVQNLVVPILPAETPTGIVTEQAAVASHMNAKKMVVTLRSQKTARTRRKKRKAVEVRDTEKLMVCASWIFVQSPTGAVEKMAEVKTNENAEILARKYATVGYPIRYFVKSRYSPLRLVNMSQMYIPRVPTTIYRVASKN